MSIYFLLCNMCSVSYPAVTTKLMSNCYPCLQMGVVQVGLGYPHHHPGHGTAPVMHPPSPGRFACTNTWGHWVSVTILEASRDCTLQAYMHTCECDREGEGRQLSLSHTIQIEHTIPYVPMTPPPCGPESKPCCA